MPAVCPWYARDPYQRKTKSMSDDGITPTSRMSGKVQLAVAIYVVVVAGFIVILVVTASPRSANAFTAGDTISLDASTE